LTFAWRFRVVENSSGLLFEQALRFPTGQAFVQHIHRHVQLLAQARGETGGFFGHFSAGAIEAEGKANDDLADTVFAGEFAQAAHIFVAIDPLEGEEGPGELRLRFGNGQADARAAVINGQDGSRYWFGLLGAYLGGHLL
jgi:hypothetical protein